MSWIHFHYIVVSFMLATFQQICDKARKLQHFSPNASKNVEP